MIYKTTVGLPTQVIVPDGISKGGLFSLDSVHLKETIIPPSGGDPGRTEQEIDIWYVGEYKTEEGVMPLGVALEDVVENGELKRFILFQDIQLKYVTNY